MGELSHKIKRANEDRVFGVFKKNCTDFPNGQENHTEEPDFVINTDSGEKIGVEVTEAVISEKEIKRMKFQFELGDLVVSKLSLVLPFSFGMSLDIYPDTILTRKEKIKIVEDVVKFCVEEFFELQNHERYKVENFDGDIDNYDEPIKKMILNHGFRTLPKGIESISLGRYDEAGSSWNECGYGMAVPRFTKEKLATIVKSKDERIYSYLTKCDICWLLIWESGGANSYYHGIEPFPYLKTEFERIFFISVYKNEVVRLK